MSEVIIKKITDHKDLKAFVRFNYELYKDNEFAVPDFYEDTLDTFNPKKNAAFDFCEVDFFLAYRDNKIVGRVAAIINKKANDTWNVKDARFGWIDFIDDPEVSKALLSAVEKWAKEHQMNRVVGPLGFTDMDPELCLPVDLTSSAPWPPSITIRIIPSTWSCMAMRKK